MLRKPSYQPQFDLSYPLLRGFFDMSHGLVLIKAHKKLHTIAKRMLSVDYVALIPVLAGAIQEQNKIIEKQNETIQQMNEAFQMLTSRLEALEKGTNNVQEKNFSFSLYPNPATSGFVTIDYSMNVNAPIGMELYSSTFGQKMKVLLPVQNQNAGSYSIQASVSGLTPGTYIVRVSSGNQVESKQLIISR